MGTAFSLYKVEQVESKKLSFFLMTSPRREIF